MKKLASLLLSGPGPRPAGRLRRHPRYRRHPPPQTPTPLPPPPRPVSLEGTTLKVGASPAPRRILAVVKELLAEEESTWRSWVYRLHSSPTPRWNGSIDANCSTFNAENGTPTW